MACFVSFDNVRWRVMPYSIGVEIGSDFADAPESDAKIEGSPRWQHENVGFWTRGEARLLQQIAAEFPGEWLEIGAHTGWTATQLIKGGARVVSIDTMFNDRQFYRRFAENMGVQLAAGQVMPWAGLSNDFFRCSILKDFSGVLIDGDHDEPNPENDARKALPRLKERGCIVLHDFRGPGPFAAGKFLFDQGLKMQVYPSVHMVAVFWRGDFDLPPQISEGETDWAAHYGLPEWAK